MDVMPFTSALVIMLAVSFLSVLVAGRPHAHAGRALHHSVYSDSSSEEADSSEEPSHDLIVKLLLDIVDVLPASKLNELDQLLSRVSRVESARDLEMPQADMPGPSGSPALEDTVDVEDQTIAKDLAATPETEEYRGEVMVLDDMNSTLAANANATGIDFAENAKLPKIRERDKDLHLKSIKNKILGFFRTTGRKPGNWSEANPEHKEMLKEVLKTMTNMSPVPASSSMSASAPSSNPATASEGSTEKIQSFYPSCSVPPDTDEDLWSGGKVMNLAFNLSYQPSVNGTYAYVSAAKLRLYKLSPANSSVTLSENCSPTADDPKSVKFCSVRIGENANTASDEKRFRVSIFRYTKSLNKRQRMKRKLLDSGMVSMGGELWTEWDVKGAVKAWKESKNFGLAVKVEDEDGTTLPADRYFVSMNCSKDAKATKPMPGFVLDAARELAMNGSSEGAPHLFPMLDLTTSDVSEEEQLKLSLEESLKHLNASSLAALQGQGKGGASFLRISMSSLHEQHRIRHHNKRKLPDATDAVSQPNRDEPQPRVVHIARLPSTS